MRDESILKVFHAARQDVEIFNNLKAMPRPLFDTQVAGMAAGFGEQIAYDALVRQMLRIELDKSSRFTDWARRPLTEAQLTYALADVTHLAALFPTLRERLETSGSLAWVEEEMSAISDPAAYERRSGKGLASPASAQDGFKYLAVFKAVAAWRERSAQSRDQPRGRHPQGRGHRRTGHPGADQPGSPEQPARRAQGLWRQQVRAGPAGRDQGRRSPIRRATPRPSTSPGPPPPQNAGAVVRAAQGAAEGAGGGGGRRLQADRHGLGHWRRSPPTQRHDAALTGWRRDAFGADALKIKRGELALVLDGAKVRVVEVRRAPKAE